MNANAQTAEKTLFRWRGRDTAHGVTRKRALQAAEALGMTETQLIHEALAQYIAQALPQYGLDFETLNDKHYAAIAKRVDQKVIGEPLSSII